MSPEKFDALRKLLDQFFAEEADEPEHAGDACAHDSQVILAMDRESVREVDQFGRLHVKVANISKADVNPYVGREIPGWEKLGLDPDKIYQMLRPPEELEKAAATANGVPLLRKHKPTSASDHAKVDTVGSTGTEARFEDPFLRNGIVVWTAEDIAGVDSGEKKQLSSGYKYRPEMTPGTFDGKHYDGVMRDLVFNHVALVEDGRAGDEVVVGDSTEALMAKATRIGALALNLTAAHVAPLLAMDAKLELPKDLFAGITSKTFKSKKPELLAGVRRALDGKLRKGLALDASTEGLAKLLDALEETAEGVDESVSEPQHKAMEAAAHGESNLGIPKKVGEEFSKADKGKTFDAEPFKAFLKEKGVGDADIEEAMKMIPQNGGAAEEESEEEKAKKAEEEKKAKEKEAADKAARDAAMKDMVSKGAMDSAIKTAVGEARKQERAIARAREEVLPWVGKLPADIACDSVDDVYRHALKMLGQDVGDDVRGSALTTILKLIPTPGSNPRKSPILAQDSATAASSLGEMFPGINDIGNA